MASFAVRAAVDAERVSSEAHSIEIATDVAETEWDGFVAAHAAASGYHRWRWRQVFENAFGHESVYLAARQNGEVTGILPLVVFRSSVFGRFAISLPFVNYGGLCARDPAAAALLVQKATDLAVDERLTHVELRHTSRRFPNLPAREHKVAMRLRLAPDPGAAWNAVDRKVRNQIRKAEKSGLTVRRGGIELVEPFYRVFARNMRDLGTPVYARRFFDCVLSTFSSVTRVFLVEHAGKVIAAGISIADGLTLEVPWASSLREHRHLCPNNLLYWTFIEDAVVRGMTTMDFGRSTPNDGTYHFKAQWGARPEPLYWEYVLIGGAAVPNFSPTNRRFSGAIEVWKRLPLGVANLLGPHIVRSIP